jgi:hypothetical protein
MSHLVPVARDARDFFRLFDNVTPPPPVVNDSWCVLPPSTDRLASAEPLLGRTTSVCRRDTPTGRSHIGSAIDRARSYRDSELWWSTAGAHSTHKNERSNMSGGRPDPRQNMYGNGGCDVLATGVLRLASGERTTQREPSTRIRPRESDSRRSGWVGSRRHRVPWIGRVHEVHRQLTGRWESTAGAGHSAYRRQRHDGSGGAAASHPATGFGRVRPRIRRVSTVTASGFV